MSSNRAYPGLVQSIPGSDPAQVPGFAGRALQTDLPGRLQSQNAPRGTPGGGSISIPDLVAAFSSKDPAAVQNLQRSFRFGSQLPLPRSAGMPMAPQAMPSYGYGNLNQYILSMQQQQQPTMFQPRPDLSNRAYK